MTTGSDGPVLRRWTPTAPLVFLVVAGPLGLALLFTSPPFRWGDENTHFRQAYRLSEGDLHPACGFPGEEETTPLGIIRLIYFTSVMHRKHPRLAWIDILRMRTIEARRDERVPAPVERAPYPPLPYVAQAMAIAVAELGTHSALALHYAARLGNFVAWLGLTWLALRVAPGLRWSLAVVALAPMTMFLATTCTVDAMANAIAFLWTATVLRVAAGAEENVRTSEVLALGVLAVALTLAKFVYAVLVPLVLLIPARRAGGRSRLLGLVGLVFAFSGAALVGWIAYSGRECFGATGITSPESVAQQWRSLTEDPSYFLRMLGQAARAVRQTLMQGLVDTKWAVHVPRIDSRLFFGALVVALVCDERSAGSRSLARRAVALGAAAAGFVAIVLVAFVYWTKAGTSHVPGLQMRYMIPLLPPLLVALEPSRLTIPGWARWLGRGTAVVIATALLVRTIQRALTIFVPPSLS